MVGDTGTEGATEDEDGEGEEDEDREDDGKDEEVVEEGKAKESKTDVGEDEANVDEPSIEPSIAKGVDESAIEGEGKKKIIRIRKGGKERKGWTCPVSLINHSNMFQRENRFIVFFSFFSNILIYN